MKFSQLTNIYAQFEKTRSGNALREILAKFLKTVPRAELERVSYLLIGQIDSYFSGIKLGLAEKMVLRAIAEASGRSPDTVLKQFKEIGDAGDVAAGFAKRSGGLTVKEVFETLHTIARTSGQGSQDTKTQLLAGLLRKASPQEARYLCRIVLENLRTGVADRTVLSGLTIAFTGNREQKKILENAYNICPDVGVIAGTLAKKGIAGVKRIGVKLGRPLQSMLCQRVTSLAEIPGLMGVPFAVEQKYDGERIQAHKDGRNVTLYSRRLENVTAQFPDIVLHIQKNVKAKTAVIDGEAMPTDPKTGKLLHFQVLMSRRRKHGITEFAKKIPVTLFTFDILYLNGKSLIAEPYKKRQELLKKYVKPNAFVRFTTKVICSTADCAEDLFDKTVQQGGEGIVIKRLDSPYEAGVRGWNWVKWKPEYVKGLQDTFDVVVVGGFYGTGRRGGKLGSYLCAVYDEKTDTFETFTKVASGFSEAELDKMHKKAMRLKVTHPPARLSYNKSLKPDVWLEPKMVIEILGAEITKSPNHTAAGGYALRFPRFVKWRDDKSAEEATTSREILRMKK